MPNRETTEAMAEDARRLDGLYAGMCQPEEYDHLVAAGLLRLTYEGLGGFMGMAKLRLIEGQTDAE